jgi:hypothetical protein
MVASDPRFGGRGALACDAAKPGAVSPQHPPRSAQHPGIIASFRRFETSDLAHGNANGNNMLRGRDAPGYRRAHTVNHGGRHVDALVAGALPGLRRTRPTAIGTLDAYSQISLVHGILSDVSLIKNTSSVHCATTMATVFTLGVRHRP